MSQSNEQDFYTRYLNPAAGGERHQPEPVDPVRPERGPGGEGTTPPAPRRRRPRRDTTATAVTHSRGHRRRSAGAGAAGAALPAPTTAGAATAAARRRRAHRDTALGTRPAVSAGGPVGCGTPARPSLPVPAVPAGGSVGGAATAAPAPVPAPAVPAGGPAGEPPAPLLRAARRGPRGGPRPRRGAPPRPARRVGRADARPGAPGRTVRPPLQADSRDRVAQEVAPDHPGSTLGGAGRAGMDRPQTPTGGQPARHLPDGDHAAERRASKTTTTIALGRRWPATATAVAIDANLGPTATWPAGWTSPARAPGAA